MRRFSWGRAALIAGGLLILFLLGTLIFMLVSSRQTNSYQLNLRLAFDLAKVDGSGCAVRSAGGEWKTLSAEDAEKFYYYMTSRTVLSLRRGNRDDARALELRIGEKTATLTPLAPDDDDRMVVRISLGGDTWRVRAEADGLWQRLTLLAAQ